MDPHQCYVEMTEAMEQADRLLVVARERAVASQARRLLSRGSFARRGADFDESGADAH